MSIKSISTVIQRYRAALAKHVKHSSLKVMGNHVHVDDWLDSPGKEFYGQADVNNDVVYAKFVLDYMRMPSYKIMAYSRFMKSHELFCTYKDQRYRVTHASRLGTIGLCGDLKQTTGADIHVFADECSLWSSKP